MKNIYENGTDWNLYENLRQFKNGSQNEARTAINIRLLFEHKRNGEKTDKIREFEAEQERQHSQIEQNR